MPPPSRKLTIVLFALLAVVIGLNIGKYVKSFTIDTAPGKPYAATRLSKDSLHRTTLRLHFVTKMTEGGCSGTAIGPHALLTAAHCETPEMNLEVDGNKATVIRMIHDDSDHVLLLLSGTTFHSYATILQEPMFQGEHVFMWGNPLHLRDIYREGYVSGFEKHEWLDGTETVNTIVTINSTFGDSGAAIFKSTGEIVGVQTFTFINGAFSVQGFLPLKFTDDQLKEAKDF